MWLTDRSHVVHNKYHIALRMSFTCEDFVQKCWVVTLGREESLVACRDQYHPFEVDMVTIIVKDLDNLATKMMIAFSSDNLDVLWPDTCND